MAKANGEGDGEGGYSADKREERGDESKHVLGEDEYEVEAILGVRVCRPIELHSSRRPSVSPY